MVLRELQALQERIKLLQEEIAASVNQDNSSRFVLAVVTVLALPINILAGLFGMNVGGVPLAQNEHGFWIVVPIVLSFTAIAAWLALRRRKRALAWILPHDACEDSGATELIACSARPGCLGSTFACSFAGDRPKEIGRFRKLNVRNCVIILSAS